MLISRAWLLSMLGPGDALDDEALAEALTGLGLEVDSYARAGVGLEPLVVGRVDGVQPHPKADRLRLVTLFDGKATRPVVCGAPNLPAPGGKVIFAPVGTSLPGGLEIGAREIRGVQSEGMICSEAELEIGPDADGIMVAPDDWEPGRTVDRYVRGWVDTVYELSITPNRPDALGHVGVARDLAVKLGRELVPPGAPLPTAPAEAELVTLQAPDRCGRYIGHAYEGAAVGPSPLWLRVLLHRLGLRPINNVVDITNLILLEWGQPLHAFDRDRLGGGRIVVRMAKPGEPMTTLDDQALELRGEDLVIADADKPQALAGVMGGIDSAVEEPTTRLVLEAAWFVPTFIRRTARAHALSTDSSYRFERGMDHGVGLTRATARACALIEQLTGARATGACEVIGALPQPPEIALRPARSHLVLGIDVPAPRAKSILQGLEVQVDDAEPETWRCVPPTHRPDLGREEDLIEELMRHYGLESLPAVATIPSGIPPARPDAEHRQVFEWSVAEALRDAGLHEQLAFVFTSPHALEPFADEVPLRQAVRIANPMREAASLMRTHMLPGLLDALVLNVARHSRPVRLFECGRIYRWDAERGVADGPTAIVDGRLPTEPGRAALLLSPGAQGENEMLDARRVAGIMLDVLSRVGVTASLRPAGERTVAYLHPGAQAVVEGAAGVVGRVGEVHPDLLVRWDLPEGVVAHYGELWLDALAVTDVAQFLAVPRFPATSRDLSIEVPVDLPAAAVLDALAEAQPEPRGDDPPRLAAGDRGGEAIEVLEDYRGEGIPQGWRALLLRLHYRAAARSVTDAEVQTLHETLVEGACRRLSSAAPGVRPR